MSDVVTFLEENRSLRQKLTKAQFRRRAVQVMRFLQSEHRLFPEDAPEKQRARILRAESDPFYFFRTYLPHYFKLRFARFHYELVSLLERRPTIDGGVLTPVVIGAPREFAKTTITSFGYCLHQFVFRKRHFIIIISDTQDLASDLTGYMYMELCYNERLIHDFGRLVRENWAVDDFVGLNDVRVKARGRGQRLRGLKHKQHRPDLIVMDDIENDRSAESPQQVRALLNWITGAAYSAIDVGGNLFIIGTALSRKSAMHTMLTSGEEPWCHWIRRTYRAVTEEGESLWPEKFPLEVLEEQRKQMGVIAFNREKMNLPDDDQGLFRSEWIRYYEPEELLKVEAEGMQRKPLVVCGWFDPSIESGGSHDYKAIVTVGLDQEEGIYYVLDAFIKKVSIEQAILTAYRLGQVYHYLVFGVEDNVFQKLLLREFEALGKDLKQTLSYRGVTNLLPKETRIAGLSPLVERGKIRFRRHHSDQDLLVEQLLYFPTPRYHDDGPDALEGAIRLLNYYAVQPAEVVSGETSLYRPGPHTLRAFRRTYGPAWGRILH